MTWHLAQPAWLLAWLVLPLLGLLHWQRLQREAAAAEAFASREAWARMGLTPGVPRRAARGLLVLGAVACLVLALAQPRQGPPGTTGPLGGLGQVVMVVDVSRSMGVMDAGGAARLQAARGHIDELMQLAPGWRFAVVAFAGDAELRCPLTTDAEAVRTLLARVKPGQGPGKGSNPEAGLRAAWPVLPKAGNRCVVLVSDGERLSGDAVAAAAEARQAGVLTHVLGVGSAEGGLVPAEPDMWGNPTFVTWQGEQVTSHAQPEEFERIATAGGGEFVDGADGDAPRRLAEALGVGAAAAAEGTGDRPRDWELFQWPLLGALVLLVAEAWLAVRRRPRPVRRFSDALHAALGGTGQVAAWLLLVSALSGASLYPTWLQNQAAILAMASGDRAGCEARLREAVARDPENARLLYNLGSVQYARGAYDEAERALTAALARAPEADRPWMRYNLGNVHVRQAERLGDRRAYERAAEDYRAVLTARPDDVDARHNLAVVERRLAEAQPRTPQRQRQGSPPSGRPAASPPPVGIKTRYSPPPMRNLPSGEEVEALLSALEREERQRQLDAPEEPDLGGDGTLPDAARLIERALRGTIEEKDW